MPNPDDRIGPYVLVRQLGRGSYGTVWLAERRTALATTRVAIKLLSDDAADLSEISRESQVWAQAGGHPNVLPIIEADVYDGRIAIVSEYAPDGSLQEWMAGRGARAPSVEAAVRMAVGILDGLEHLHARRIVHRDLKPANILLLGETPRLADFGLARVMRTGMDSASIAGTPAYMAPETFDGKRSEQSDLWAAGIILYELLTGRFPFPRTNIAQLIGSIVDREPDPLGPDVPEAIGAVVRRALAKDPAERFRSAAQMRDALVAAASARSPGASPGAVRTAPGVPGFGVGGELPSAPPRSDALASTGRASGTRSATFPTASATMPVVERPNALTHPALWAAVSLAVILAVGSFFVMQAFSRSSAATSEAGTLASASEPERRSDESSPPAAPTDASAPSSAATAVPVAVSDPVAPAPSVQERVDDPAPQPGLRSDGDTLRGELPASGDRAEPAGAAAAFDVAGTWEDVDQCAGSRFEIVRQGDRIVQIYGTAHCDGATIPWSAYNIRMISPTEVTYQTAWQSTTLTCKIAFRPGGTAVKSFRTANGSWGSVQLRKVG